MHTENVLISIRIHIRSSQSLCMQVSVLSVDPFIPGEVYFFKN